MDAKSKEIIQKIAAGGKLTQLMGGAKSVAHEYDVPFKSVLKDRGGLREVAKEKAGMPPGPQGKVPASRSKDASAHDRQYVEGHRTTASPDIGARIVDDFIKGAQRNPRLGHVQVGDVPEGIKLASAPLTALEIAKLGGVLIACDEAELTFKEASEYLGIPEEELLKIAENLGRSAMARQGADVFRKAYDKRPPGLNNPHWLPQLSGPRERVLELYGLAQDPSVRFAEPEVKAMLRQFGQLAGLVR